MVQQPSRSFISQEIGNGHNQPPQNPSRKAAGDIGSLTTGSSLSLETEVDRPYERQAQERLFEQAGELAKLGAWRVDVSTRSVYWDAQVYTIYEVDDTDFSPTLENTIGFYGEESQSKLRQAFDQAINTGEPFNLDLSLTTAKGNGRWINAKCRLIMEDNHTVSIVGIFQDITDRKELESNLREKSHTDPLTRVGNREMLAKQIKDFSESPWPVGVVFMDVDGLRDINNTLGHREGDKLLENLGRILRENFRSQDIVVRTGGDEFVAIIPTNDEKIIKKIISRIETTLEAHNAQPDNIKISISLGYKTSDSSRDLQELIEAADAAMYRRKAEK